MEPIANSHTADRTCSVAHVRALTIFSAGDKRGLEALTLVRPAQQAALFDLRGTAAGRKLFISELRQLASRVIIANLLCK